MSLILIQETASSIPNPPSGKTTIYTDTTGSLQIKQANGAVAGIPTITTSNTQVMFNDSNSIGGSSNFVYANNTNTLTVSNLSVTGTLSAGDISVSSIANGTSNVDIVGVSGNVTTSVAGNANILVVTGTGVVVSGNLTANGSVGNGIVGGAKTSGSTRGTGVTGQGYVTSSTDTGAAVGVRGFATDTHSGGYNVGVLGNASGSGLGNYAFYVQAGNIASIETPTAWDLYDNSPAAISFNSSGKANILGIETTDGAEGIFTSGYLNVTGNVTATRLISNIATGTAPLTVTSTTRVANLNVATSGVANTVNDAAQPNITSVGTLATLSVSGNANVGNIGTATAIITTGNITTINSGLLQNGNSNIAITANGNISITAAGGSPELVVTSTGANITGTLSASGNANVANLGVTGVFATTLSSTGNSNVGNLGTAGLITVTGNVTAGNLVTSGALSVTGNANVGNIGATNIVGTLTTASQTNITSIGTLTTLSVSGNANVGNIGTTGNVTAGNLVTSGALSVTGNANVGNIGATLFVGNVSGTGNSNVGNLGTTQLVATGAGSFGANLNMNTNWINNVGYPSANGDAASKLYVDTLVSTGVSYHQPVYVATTTTLATATGGTTAYNSPNGAANGIGAYISTTGTFTNIDGFNVQSVGRRILVKDEANAAWNGVYTYANTTAIVRSTDTDEAGTGSITLLGINDYFFTQNGTVNEGVAFIVSAPSGTITFGTSNITFSVFSTSQVYDAGTGLTLTGTTFSVNASQTQITAVGTLTTLSVSGNANVGNIGATLFVGNLSGTGNSNVGNLGATGVFATTLSATGNANVGNIGATNIVGTLTTASQTNITSVGTLTSLSVSGNANIGNIGTGGLITVTGNVTAGNLVTAGVLSVTGNANVGNIGAVLHVGNLSGTGNSNVGNLGATGVFATTLSSTGNANVGNIGGAIATFTGNIDGANVIVDPNGSLIHSVNASVSAAGTVQGNATALLNDINVITTCASGAGVVLPTAVAGMRKLVFNTTANACLVYPASGAAINAGASNASYSLAAGARLEYISTSTTQWYTVNATYA